MVFQPLVLEFLRRYPDMAVDIVTEGLLVDIIAEGFDAGLRVSSLVPLDMIRVPISGNVSMTVVGSADYFARAC
jgi:DNA-binding transcriptional LysR family regulator